MARRGKKNRGKRGKNARQKARENAQKRIQKIKDKPGKPTPAQRDRIKNLRSTVKANTGRRNPPKAASKPAPKPSPSRTNNRGPAPTAQGRGPVTTAQTTPRSSFSASNQPTYFGTNTRSAKPIDKGGSVPSVMSNQYSGNSPRNFDHGDKFTKKDVRAMRDMGFTAQQTKDYIAENNLGGTRQGKRIISQSRGEFDKSGQYDYGLQFGKGDIRRLRQAGSTNEQIRNYISQQSIDNKVAQRFLTKNPAQIVSDASGQTPTPTDTPPKELGDPIDTTLDPTVERGDGEPTETVEASLADFDLKDIQDYLDNQGYSITENIAPQPTPEPTPAPQYNQEQSGLNLTFGFGSPETTVLPSPVATGSRTTNPAPTPTAETRKSPFDLTDFRNEQATALADARQLLNAPATDKPLVNVDRPIQNQQYITPSPVGASGQPYIQPRNTYTNMPYTLDEDGMPVYSTFTYQTGSTIPGQVVPGGSDLYEPVVPPMPKVELGPYDPRKQYGPGGMGYLTLQPRGIPA